jgi:hypothetical protein
MMGAFYKTDICDLLRKLFAEGNLDIQSWNLLIVRLKGVIKIVSAKTTSLLQKSLGVSSATDLVEAICAKRRMDKNQCLEDIVSELILKLVSPNTRRGLEVLTTKPVECKRYLYTLVRNFLIDLWRKESNNPPYEEMEVQDSSDRQEFAQKLKEGEILTSDQKKEIQELEIIHLKEIFFKNIPPQDYKYFCYFLIKDGKEIYKCLWGNKSQTAIYKDASRKKDKVIKFLERLRDQYGFDLEDVRTFVINYLSELCEQLRLKTCKEEK